MFLPRYLAAMSTKDVRTAADLVRFKTALKVECTSCGNSRTLSGFDVAKHCGTQDLRQLQRRYKCTLCGAREASLTVLSRRLRGTSAYVRNGWKADVTPAYLDFFLALIGCHFGFP